MSSDRPCALITGASAGIGRELAFCFARDQYNLVLVARRRELLDALAAELKTRFGVETQVVVDDLSDPAAPARVMEAASWPIDALVNNAGFGSQGPFAWADPRGQADMVQVNVAALTMLTRLALPGMLSRNTGRVLNVASTAAFLPGPLMAVYYATKAYVLSFSEAVADELRGSPVTVTALCPGPTATEFDKQGGISKTRVFSGRLMDAGVVARVGYAAMNRGRRVAIVGLRNRLMVRASRLAPRRLLTRIAHRLNQS